MTNTNRLTAREVAVSAARDEIASREARIAEIRSEEIRIEEELRPLYEQRRILRLNKSEDERTIKDCEKIIDGRFGWLRKPTMTAEHARTTMAAARERVSAAAEVESELGKQIKPVEEPFYELSGERRKLEREIAVYQKIVSSQGDCSYNEAEYALNHPPRLCMA